MGKKRFYDAVRDLIRDVHEPPEQPSRTRRRLSISSLLAAPQVCAACWDPVPNQGPLFSCNQCLGAFCPTCLSQYARSALGDRNLLPLRCADQECRAPIPLSALRGLLTADERAKLSRFQCDMMRQPDTTLLPSMEAVTDQIDDRDNEAALQSLMGTMGWRRCPDCGTGIERTHGCPHMVCVCGGEFCYSCGERWGPGGFGCPRRCGLPQNPDALLALFPARFDALRDEVWQRIAAVLESLRDHLERDQVGRTLRPLETWQRDLPRVSTQRQGLQNGGPLPTGLTRTATHSESRPAKMRLRSLVHPSRENRL